MCLIDCQLCFSLFNRKLSGVQACDLGSFTNSRLGDAPGPKKPQFLARAADVPPVAEDAEPEAKPESQRN